MDRQLSPRQQEVFEALVAETKKNAAPTLGRLLALTELAPSTVRQCLSSLVLKGYVTQDYDKGPYRPIRPVGELPTLSLTSDACPLRVSEVSDLLIAEVEDCNGRMFRVQMRGGHLMIYSEDGPLRLTLDRPKQITITCAT